MELTKEEGQVLINLINIAVQARGLEAAESGLHFVKKIQEYLNKPQLEAIKEP